MKNFLLLCAVTYLVINPSISSSTENGTDDGCMKNGCHEKFKLYMETRKIKHPPASKGSCTICHIPHGENSPEDHSLIRPVSEVCFACHQEFEASIETAAFLHTPVREDRCGDCHLPHGSYYTKIRKWYEPSREWIRGIFGGYEGLENAWFCIQCHDEDTYIHDKITTKTDFRNGAKNLHQRHFRRIGSSNCVKCHDVHGSYQEFHIASEIPFGDKGFTLSITFTLTSNGGKCVLSCHQTMVYDRDNPAVKSESSTPKNELGSE